MKNLLIILILMIGGFVNGQQSESTGFAVMIDGNSGPNESGICIVHNRFCLQELQEEYSNDELVFGEFILDTNDYLILSIDKDSISLENIFLLFEGNKLIVEYPTLHSQNVIDGLNLKGEFTRIKSGTYTVSENHDNTKYIINFGRVNSIPENNQQSPNQGTSTEIELKSENNTFHKE